MWGVLATNLCGHLASVLTTIFETQLTGLPWDHHTEARCSSRQWGRCCPRYPEESISGLLKDLIRLLQMRKGN